MSHDIADGFQRGDFKLPPTLAEMVRDGELGADIEAQSLASMAAPLRASLDWVRDFQGMIDRLHQPLTTSDFETLLSEARARTQAITHDADEDDTVRNAARSTNAIVTLTERVVRLERLFSQVLPGVYAEVETMHGAVIDALESINRAKKNADLQSQIAIVWKRLFEGAEALGTAWSDKLKSGALPFKNSDLVALCMAHKLLQKTDDGGDYSDEKYLGEQVTKFFQGKDMFFARGRPSKDAKKHDFLNACWDASEGLQKPPATTPTQLRKTL